MLRVWDLKSNTQITEIAVQKEITSIDLTYDASIVTLTAGALLPAHPTHLIFLLWRVAVSLFRLPRRDKRGGAIRAPVEGLCGKHQCW